MAKNAPNAILTITPVERDDEPELGEPVVLLDVVGVSDLIDVVDARLSLVVVVVAVVAVGIVSPDLERTCIG